MGIMELASLRPPRLTCIHNHPGFHAPHFALGFPFAGAQKVKVEFGQSVPSGWRFRQRKLHTVELKNFLIVKSPEHRDVQRGMRRHLGVPGKGP